MYSHSEQYTQAHTTAAMDSTDATNNIVDKPTNTTLEGDQPPVKLLPQIPKAYTLRQAFIKKCLRECQRNAPRSSFEEDMLLEGLTNNDKTTIIDHYEYRNSPMRSSDVPPPYNKYYLQYHAFDLVVFKKHAKQAWSDVVQYFKYNKDLEKKYTKNINYKLQMYQQCRDSLSTTIQLLIAYPRNSHKYEESCDHFLNNSGLREQFPIWNITACKSYSYLSREEYIKLLNTHADGCFASELYPRFRISVPRAPDDDDTVDDDDCNDDTDTAEDSSTDNDDGSDDDDESGSSDAGDSTDECADGMLSTNDANDDICDADVGTIDGSNDGNDNSCNASTAVRTSASARRAFKSPHPDVGISSDKMKKKKPSKLQSLIAEMSNVEHCNNNATKSPHKHQILPRRKFYPSEARSRYFRATTFMKHSITCGGHKQDIVAKDIHTGTNTLIFHARSYNMHHKKDVIRSRDYLLPYSPAVPSAGGSATASTTSNKRKKPLPATSNDTNDAVKEKPPKKQKKQ